MIYDDDRYYMGNVIAELLRNRGNPVTLVTPGSVVSSWSEKTGEHSRVVSRMSELGVEVVTAHALSAFDGEAAELQCCYTGNTQTRPADAVVMVTMREPADALYQALAGLDELPFTLARIGDCEAPSIIAGAVYSGHRYARELEAGIDRDNRMKYDRVFFDDCRPG